MKPVLKGPINTTPGVSGRKERNFNKFLIPQFNSLRKKSITSTSSGPSNKSGGPNVAIQVYLNNLTEKIEKLESEIE